MKIQKKEDPWGTDFQVKKRVVSFSASIEIFRCVQVRESVQGRGLYGTPPAMLNFRKIRQDFSSGVLKEGKGLHEQEVIRDAKILHLDGGTVRIACHVQGAFEHVYPCEVEIDRQESMMVDSQCGCSKSYDCQHVAAFLFHLEGNLNEIIVTYSQETDLDEVDEDEKEELLEAFEEAATKEEVRRDESRQKEMLADYASAAGVLASSPFFLPLEQIQEDQAELGLILLPQANEPQKSDQPLPFQLSLRVQGRAKALLISHVQLFLQAVRYREPIKIGGKRYYFTMRSFSCSGQQLLQIVSNHAKFAKGGEERLLRIGYLDHETLGTLLAAAFEEAVQETPHVGSLEPLPHLYWGSMDQPLQFSTFPARIEFLLEYLEIPAPSLLMRPSVVIDGQTINPHEAMLFETAKPGILHETIYYRFAAPIRRQHLCHLEELETISVPEPLFGTFIENTLPQLRAQADVVNPKLVERFVTLPYTQELRARCTMHYLDCELDCELFFLYDDVEIPAALSKLTPEHLATFVKDEGILGRNLVKEQQLIDALFQAFLYDETEGVYKLRSEKHIVEFMTEIVPRYADQIDFECPENLSDQFIYDASTFELHCRTSDQIDSYAVEVKVDGYLKGTRLDQLWECLAQKKTYIELEVPQATPGRKSSKMPKILVLDLARLAPIVQIFDEIGIECIDDHVENRPLWSLTTINPEQFKDLPVKFSMTKDLREVQKQILGETPMEPTGVPADVCTELRNYQVEGVHWLERLRKMHLGGILADDMGLGKTVQAIAAITQAKKELPDRITLIVCPTSLVYNWKEELHRFNPLLKTIVVDNIPSVRKKLLAKVPHHDVVITSYNLLQKDIETYGQFPIGYAILDEAQHIKNRGTRNARSVKLIQGVHRLILTGTPIENSLDELWSLFDYLMPGLLGNYERFVEKYVRTNERRDAMTKLQKKLAPFILRRMKDDVLDDLPPVSEVLYHCSLSDTQKELYQSYAASAKEELSRLVKKEGFDKIQIHVLATLTRLKQICCHPAIFAKEKAEEGDSAKYDLLMELLPSLIEGGHKTVIFSQYTKMLQIMREDLSHRGIRFAYLDGATKNRLEIVKQFNKDADIPVFLVSLKAGGAGLNLVGADTVIHYDMWWNPAVENQARDRVHRIGQKKSVSSYKLITLDTIEEKILNLQKRKKELVKMVIKCDDDAIAKLTWEEVLELLQT